MELPVVGARCVFAVRGATATPLERAARETRLVGGDAGRRLSSILSILVVLVKTGGRVLRELEIFGGVWGGLGRVLMTRAHGNLLCPFWSLGYWELV